jgi:hypothetical protein
MQHTLTKEAPALLIDVVLSIVAFFLMAGWWKVSGRELDRDTTVFLAKICGGICLFGMLLAFIM